MTTISEAELAECLNALYRFAYSLTRNDDRARDLVQDCVERCLRKQHLFDGQNLRSWMFTVCRRIFVNQVRRDQARGSMVDMDDAPSRRLSVEAVQHARVEYTEMLTEMSRLSAGDQQVLQLIAVDGLKYDEVAATLDVPVGTVRSRLSRARTKLRALIEGAVPEPAAA